MIRSFPVILMYNAKLNIKIKGDSEEYSLTNDKISSEETVTLIILNWNERYFRLLVGKEAFEFGVQRDFNLQADIEDSEGTSVEVDIEFIDSDLYIEKKYNRSVNQIFNELGEQKFREYERDASKGGRLALSYPYFPT